MIEEKYDFQRAKKENAELADRMLRWLSFPISKFIIRHTPIVPNQITLFSISLGKWLDGITDYLSPELIIFSLAIGIGTPLAYLVGAFTAIAYPMQYLFVYFYKLEIVKSSEPIAIGEGNKFNFLRHIYGSVLFYVLVPLFLFMNKPLWALLFFAVVGNAFWAGTLLAQYLTLRKKD